MSLSATSVALILSIVSTAHGAPAVPGEVRKDAPATETTSADTVDVATEEVVLEPRPEDEAMYGRLFGEEPEIERPEAPMLKETRENVWPWWVWPIGLLTIGVLFLMRGKARERLLPNQAIRIVSRSVLGKEGTLAVIEIADGDHRTRRLPVGFGSGAPRLVADVSAWDVAVAAPAPQSAAAPHHTGPDPMLATATSSQPESAEEVCGTFEGTLRSAAGRYESTAALKLAETPGPVEQDLLVHDDLVAEVLAMRDTIDITTEGKAAGQRRPAYSRRQVVA